MQCRDVVLQLDIFFDRHRQSLPKVEDLLEKWIQQGYHFNDGNIHELWADILVGKFEAVSLLVKYQ